MGIRITSESGSPRDGLTSFIYGLTVLGPILISSKNPHGPTDVKGFGRYPSQPVRSTLKVTRINMIVM
jgi:hypothetical protein